MILGANQPCTGIAADQENVTRHGGRGLPAGPLESATASDSSCRSLDYVGLLRPSDTRCSTTRRPRKKHLVGAVPICCVSCRWHTTDGCAGSGKPNRARNTRPRHRAASQRSTRDDRRPPTWPGHHSASPAIGGCSRADHLPLGDTASTVALVVLLFQLTGSGLGVSGVVIAEILPVLLLAPIAGAAVNRLPRIQVMISADVIRMALAMMLPLVDQH